LVHDTADGDHESQGSGSHAGNDQRRNAAAVRFRLAALRLRPAERDHRPAVPFRTGEAEYSGAQCGADFRAGHADQEDSVVKAACPAPQRTATAISPIRSNATVITSPGLTGATPWQVPDMMMSPG